MDLRQYYLKEGELSYELDCEHTDEALTRIELELLAPWLQGLKKAVHLCCGAGRHVLAFAGMGVPSIGLDISPYLVRKGAQASDGCGGLALADVCAAPIRSGTADCVTLLGNSLALFPEPQGRLVLMEASRILCPSGVLFLDLPHPDYFLSTTDRPRFLKRSFVTKTLGPVEWTWLRSTDPLSRTLTSCEAITFTNSQNQQETRELSFTFNIHTPEKACTMASPAGLSPIHRLECTDTTGTYKGMLRRRVLLILRKV